MHSTPHVKPVLSLGLCLALGLLLLPACSTTERAADATVDAAEEVGDFVTDAAGTAYRSVADLFDDDDEIDAAALVRPVGGGEAQGTITFEMEDDELEVEVSLRGLAPGEHGLHVHTNGTCSPPGEHFDPMATNDHGGPDEAMSAKHAGDLGNVTADADGTVDAEVEVEGLALTGAEGLVGHAIVVHSGRDDLETDPSGNSGTPIGCGVIEAR